MTHENSNIIFDTIAIVGVGLIGGSLGMAAKKNGLARRVIGLGRTEQKLMRAKILGAIDDYSLDIETGASEADLVIVCTPVRKIAKTIALMASSLKNGCIVTDVGSTKRQIVSEATAAVGKGKHFIGGHPMAGTENSGVDAAFPDLFLGATYVLTPTSESNVETVGKMTDFVEGIGARLEVMTAEKHDISVAVISHLPHAMAGALLHCAESSQHVEGSIFRLAAGSFRDLTRISDSSPDIWRDIFLTNADTICETIDAFIQEMQMIKSSLMDCDEEAIMKFFDESQQIRQTYIRLSKS